MIIQEVFQRLMDFIHWYVTDAAQVLTFRIVAALFAARIIFNTSVLCWPRRGPAHCGRLAKNSQGWNSCRNRQVPQTIIIPKMNIHFSE